MHSKIVTRFLVEHHTKGFIQIESTEENTFSIEDQKVLEWFAVDAALAINNAQQYENLKQTQYEATFHLHLALIGLWSADFKHTFTQNILGVRSWLYQIKTIVDQDQIDKAKIHESLKEIEAILSTTQQMPVSEDYPIFNLDKNNKVISTQAFRMNEALQEIVDEICENHLHIQVVWDLKYPGILIPMSIKNFQIIVEKLVHNALKAMSWAGTLTIWTEKTNNKFIDIHFKDTGSGMSPEKQKDFLVLPLGQEDKKSSGYGSLIAKLISFIHKGDLFLIWSEEGVGTELCLRLPVIDA
jgi:K+-sensing histidine kinase KdpD